jgi:hypothetical protein
MTKEKKDLSKAKLSDTRREMFAPIHHQKSRGPNPRRAKTKTKRTPASMPRIKEAFFEVLNLL